MSAVTPRLELRKQIEGALAGLPDLAREGVRLDGQALREAREAARFSLVDLAAGLRVAGAGPGFSPSRLSLVETGQDVRPVGEWQAQVWATALGVPLSSVLRYRVVLSPPPPPPADPAPGEPIVLRRLMD